MIPLAIAENAHWQEVFKLPKPSDYLLVSLRVSEICEWVMESVQEKKNELSTVTGTAPVTDGRPNEKGQSPVIRLTYIETHTHTRTTQICIHEN